jgi:protein-S-isoprenylcysteine O-methyltransferase Ste14
VAIWDIKPDLGLVVAALIGVLAGGLVAVFSMQHSSMADTWWMVQFVVVPQACFDAVVGAALLWVVEQRLAVPRFGVLDRY